MYPRVRGAKHIRVRFSEFVVYIPAGCRAMERESERSSTIHVVIARWELLLATALGMPLYRASFLCQVGLSFLRCRCFYAGTQSQTHWVNLRRDSDSRLRFRELIRVFTWLLRGSQWVWSVSSLITQIPIRGIYGAPSPPCPGQLEAAPHNIVYFGNHFCVALIFCHEAIFWVIASFQGKKARISCRKKGRHRRKAVFWP